MRKFRSNWGVFAAAVAAANGCGGQSVQQITGDDSGAVGGGVNVGGAAGRGGAAGSGVAGRGAAGRRPGAGNGGDAGGFDVGGAPVRGGTGSGAGGNYPTVIASSPNCQCVAESADSFDCVMSLDASAPETSLDGICDRLDWVTRRSTCANGVFLYRSVEGYENDFELVVDAQGKPTYYRASGYVGGCGVDRQYSTGSIIGGAKPPGCTDEYTCAWCADALRDYPACPACTPNPDDAQGVTLSLDEYCQWSDCPDSVAAAKTSLATSCDAHSRPTVTNGCGGVEVRQEAGLGMLVYFYDEASGKLVGLIEEDDLAHGPCNSFSYRVGDVPSETCSAESTCEFCAPAGDGAAGAGGEAGSGSTTNLCPP